MKIEFLLLVLTTSLIPCRATAQTFTTLHSFTAIHLGQYTNSDGANPYAGLILSGNTLYGTTHGGGSSGNGTVFAVNTDGTGFTNLHNFTGPPYYGTNSEGASPSGGLILSGNTLYGTAAGGGSGGVGTVFALNTDGTGFTNLHIFAAGGYDPSSDSTTNSDGAFPEAGLLLSGNTLYGTTTHGGSWGIGTVFAVKTDGTGFTNVHTFNALSFGPPYPTTNSDGACAHAGLTLTHNTLFGTAEFGGNSGYGTVFALNTDGTGFTNLHSFPATAPDGNGLAHTNSDGATPRGGLLLSGNTLYGTSASGGSGGVGTVFALNTDGTSFTNLHSFAEGYIDYPNIFINGEGNRPQAGLILSGNTLYGAAYTGGAGGAGTVFALNTGGTGFRNFHTFTPLSSRDPITGDSTNTDGATPQGGLLFSGNTLYGTSATGGSGGVGTVFSLSFRPKLTFTPSGTNVILSWPTNVAGFDYAGYKLQSATNLGTSAVWTTNLPSPVIVNGQYTVTNPIAGRQQFFRLSQ